MQPLNIVWLTRKQNCNLGQNKQGRISFWRYHRDKGMQCFSLQGQIPLGRERANMQMYACSTVSSAQMTFILYSFLTHRWFHRVFLLKWRVHLEPHHITVIFSFCSSICLFNLLNRELAILLDISVHSLEDTNMNTKTWCGQKRERNQACDEFDSEMFCLIFHVWKRTHSHCRCSVKCWFQGWPIQGDR